MLITHVETITFHYSHACELYLHMQEGCCPAESFSSTNLVAKTVSGCQLPPCNFLVTLQANPNLKDLQSDALHLSHHFRLESSKAVSQLSGTYYFCI